MKFEVNGYNLDNLLKTLYQKRIVLKDINRTKHNVVSFSVDDKDEKRVKRFIQNYKVTKGPKKKQKLPKFLLANLGIIIGCFFGIVLSIFMSSFTWQIKVYGLKDLTEHEVVNVLKDNNVSVGKINLTTNKEIEDILLNNYDRIAQVSVIKQGSAIIINLSEKLVYVEEDCEPIKAQFNGIITNINIITGTKNCKVGDYVNVGDILVLPFNISPSGEKVGVKPMAEIVGEIFITSTVELNRVEQVLVRSGKSIKTYDYLLFNNKIFSGKHKNSFALFECLMYNENISNLLPLKRKVTEYFELVETPVEHDFASEKEGLISRCKEKSRENLPVGEIIDESCNCSVVGDKMIAVSKIIVLGNLNANYNWKQRVH